MRTRCIQLAVGSVLLIVLLIGPATSLWAAVDRAAYGVWSSDEKGDMEAFPCKGMVVDFKWAQIEPTEGVFDWKQFDAQMEQAAAAGLYTWVGISVNQPYLRRFKKEHPEQAVLLHANGCFRKPEADPSAYYDGH